MTIAEFLEKIGIVPSVNDWKRMSKVVDLEMDVVRFVHVLQSGNDPGENYAIVPRGPATVPTFGAATQMQYASDLGFIAKALLEHRRSSEADMSSVPKGYNPVVKDRLPLNMYDRLEQIARRDRGVIRRGN